MGNVITRQGLPELFSSQEVALEFGVTAMTVSTWVRESKLEAAVRIPGRKGNNLFTRREIERWRKVRDSA